MLKGQLSVPRQTIYKIKQNQIKRNGLWENALFFSQELKEKEKEVD